MLHRLQNVDVGDGDAVLAPVHVDGMLYLAGVEKLLGIRVEDLLRSSSAEWRVVDGEAGFPTESEKAPALRPAVTVPLGGSGPVCATPACRGDRMVCVSDLGELLCVDVAAGTVRWQQHLASVLASPIIAGNA